MTAKPSDHKIFVVSEHNYCVALNFCGCLFSRIGDFLYFVETYFCNWKRLVFLAGNYFLRFSGSRVQIELIRFSFFI